MKYCLISEISFLVACFCRAILEGEANCLLAAKGGFDALANVAASLCGESCSWVWLYVRNVSLSLYLLVSKVRDLCNDYCTVQQELSIRRLLGGKSRYNKNLLFPIWTVLCLEVLT